RRAQHAAKSVRVGACDARTKIRDPQCQSIGVILLDDGVAAVVAAPERHGAAQGFDVVAAAAAGTIVDQQLRIALQQSVPERKITLDVEILSDALALHSVAVAPKDQRLDVEILPVYVDLFLSESLRKVFDQPIHGIRVAEVQDSSISQRHSLIDRFSAGRI